MLWFGKLAFVLYISKQIGSKIKLKTWIKNFTVVTTLVSDVPAQLGLKAAAWAWLQVAWAFRICKLGPSHGLSTVNA